MKGITHSSNFCPNEHQLEKKITKGCYPSLVPLIVVFVSTSRGQIFLSKLIQTPQFMYFDGLYLCPLSRGACPRSSSPHGIV
jgi:hypothetical protein